MCPEYEMDGTILSSMAVTWPWPIVFTNSI